jgi:hypothetical protein
MALAETASEKKKSWKDKIAKAAKALKENQDLLDTVTGMVVTDEVAEEEEE